LKKQQKNSKNSEKTLMKQIDTILISFPDNIGFGTM